MTDAQRRAARSSGRLRRTCRVSTVRHAPPPAPTSSHTRAVRATSKLTARLAAPCTRAVSCATAGDQTAVPTAGRSQPGRPVLLTRRLAKLRPSMACAPGHLTSVKSVAVGRDVKSVSSRPSAPGVPTPRSAPPTWPARPVPSAPPGLSLPTRTMVQPTTHAAPSHKTRQTRQRLTQRQRTTATATALVAASSSSLWCCCCAVWPSCVSQRCIDVAVARRAASEMPSSTRRSMMSKRRTRWKA
mmetsp:Transcript_529/g.1622  ORF Transcript_529/g.1622 Transcript_529/m.1622 type:complete len:243 (-) Transcript_529:1137-1865(-)